MNPVTLAVHQVRVKRVHDREFARLDSFGDTADDLFDVLKAILKSLKDPADNEDIQQIIEVAEVHQEGRQLYGIVNSGAYGTESVLRDIKDDFKPAFQKRVHHADTMPFYFHFDVPESSDVGLLALQRTGIYGIYQVLHAVLDKRFQERFPEQRLLLNLAVPKEVIERYVGDTSELKEIRFIRHKLSSDVAGMLDPKHRQAAGSMELSVKIREAGVSIPAPIRKYILGERPTGNGGLLEMFDVKFAYDSIKIKTKTDGRPRTVNVADPLRGFRADFDVSDRIKLRGGHPTLASMKEVASELLEDIWRMMYGKRA